MNQRAAIIPGVDPEVELHGKLPMAAEPAPAMRLSAIDLRDDRAKFADLANPLIDSFPERLRGLWHRFNSVACSVRDAVFHNRLLFHAGLPVMGLGNLRWEAKAAEVAGRGELQLPRPETHYTGRTGLLAGRSAFNYYHFTADTLIFMEELADLADRMELDRIVVDPCIGADDGFQWRLIRRIYPRLAERVIFSQEAFSADHLSFACIWPGVFHHEEGCIVQRGPRGVARRAFRSVAKPFFERAERELGSRDFNDRRDVIIVSRRDAIRRRTINEDDLVEALTPFGARAVVLENLSVAKQMDLMAGARVVIGPHGAGMINTGFCQAGTTAIELTGRHYLPRGLMFATVGIVRHMNYQFLVADEHGDIEAMTGNEGNDIRLSKAAVDHMVEVVDAALSADAPRAALAATHGLVEERSADLERAGGAT